MSTKDKADLLDNAEDIAIDDVPGRSDSNEAPTGPANQDSETAADNARVTADVIHVDTPVYFSSNGNASVVCQQTVFNRTDGTQVIVTPGPTAAPPSRQLREADLQFLRVFSFISIFVFPPTGIAAYVYALETERKFHDGVARGDMSVAQKSSATCEKLIIASLIAGLLMYMFIFSLTEKFIFGMQETPIRFPSSDYAFDR
ncbi:hypothetical protein LSAT2_019234 [Lamellibrachia satsuma]|nr:hypothetical protein LSAT2_019234 [Lamellibrachia satsuma]